jgi:crossover junction endodeoxyribonuclease RuvC
MRILGIDPGLRKTGFGVIEIINNQPKYIISGVIQTNTTDNIPNRLKTIFDGLNQIIIQTKPDIASVEKIFFNINPQSSLLLGQARGTSICSCVHNNLEVFEYTALQVKQSVVGYGHADKIQISKMVRYLLNLNKQPQTDAADALANALAHHYYAKAHNLFNVSSKRKNRMM